MITNEEAATVTLTWWRLLTTDPACPPPKLRSNSPVVRLSVPVFLVKTEWWSPSYEFKPGKENRKGPELAQSSSFSPNKATLGKSSGIRLGGFLLGPWSCILTRAVNRCVSVAWSYRIERHHDTGSLAYRCFLPDLTGFTSACHVSSIPSPPPTGGPPGPALS